MTLTPSDIQAIRDNGSLKVRSDGDAHVINQLLEHIESQDAALTKAREYLKRLESSYVDPDDEHGEFGHCADCGSCLDFHPHGENCLVAEALANLPPTT